MLGNIESCKNHNAYKLIIVRIN